MSLIKKFQERMAGGPGSGPNPGGGSRSTGAALHKEAWNHPDLEEARKVAHAAASEAVKQYGMEKYGYEIGDDTDRTAQRVIGEKAYKDTMKAHPDYKKFVAGKTRLSDEANPDNRRPIKHRGPLSDEQN